MTSLTETTDYDNFDPECYMKTHDWSSIGEEEERSIFQFTLDAMHAIFDSGESIVTSLHFLPTCIGFDSFRIIYPGAIKGHSLLDIGTGPTIRTIVSACVHVDHVYLSDINERNRAALTDWWKGSGTVELELTDYILKKENTGDSAEQRQRMMKAKIRGILPIDVRSGHPLGKGDHPGQFDVITATCFEATSQTAEAYQKVVKNAASLLKVGGHMFVVGLFNNTHYVVGQFKFMCASLSQDEIQRIYTTCGFRIINISRKILGKDENWTPKTCSGSFAMHVVKTI